MRFRKLRIALSAGRHTSQLPPNRKSPDPLPNQSARCSAHEHGHPPTSASWGWKRGDMDAVPNFHAMGLEVVCRNSGSLLGGQLHQGRLSD